MRTNFVRPEKVGRGQTVDHTKARRVFAFLDDETFDLLRERAVERGVGMSAIVRETIDAGLLQLLPRA
jgi:hypothetical protein